MGAVKKLIQKVKKVIAPGAKKILPEEYNLVNRLNTPDKVIQEEPAVEAAPPPPVITQPKLVKPIVEGPIVKKPVTGPTPLEPAPEATVAKKKIAQKKMGMKGTILTGSKGLIGDPTIYKAGLLG